MELFPPAPFLECFIVSPFEVALRNRCFAHFPRPDILNAVSNAGILNFPNPTSGIALIRGTASLI